MEKITAFVRRIFDCELSKGEIYLLFFMYNKSLTKKSLLETFNKNYLKETITSLYRKGYLQKVPIYKLTKKGRQFVYEMSSDLILFEKNLRNPVDN